VGYHFRGGLLGCMARNQKAPGTPQPDLEVHMPAPKQPRKRAQVKKPARRAASKPASARKNPAVDEWFNRSDHALKPLMLNVRRVILASDKRVSESIKWSTPTFSYNGDIASFIPQAKSFVSLLFHRGAEIPGNHPRLEGDSRLARTMRFASAEELKQYTPDLQNVIRAWCDHRTVS
jgi:hypothetical protein